MMVGVKYRERSKRNQGHCLESSQIPRHTLSNTARSVCVRWIDRQAEERTDGHKDVNAGMMASLHTPPCPGMYHPGPQYSKFQTWLQKFLTVFER